ncbi:MAG TPA: hypothetical protein DD415_01435 [Clostridiales bacterium]|nr:hypothetical protein [Clostridiales bacterium]
MEEINPRLNSATGGIAYTAAAFTYFIALFVVSLILRLTALDAESDAYLYISYLISPVAISLSVFGVLKFRKISFKSIVPVKCNPKYFLIAALLIYGLVFALSWVNGVSVKFFELFGYKQREAGSYLPDLSGGKVALALLVIAVLPALFEELLFRGIILNSCENGAGTVRTVFIVGFCFSLFHASPEQTVYQFITGCAFAFVALRSGSILPSVLMHFINNALIVIFAACGLFDEAGNLIISTGGNIALIVTSAIALIGALVWLILDKNPLKKCEKGGVKSFFICASPAIAAFAIVWLVSLFGVA